MTDPTGKPLFCKPCRVDVPVQEVRDVPVMARPGFGMSEDEVPTRRREVGTCPSCGREVMDGWG